LTKLLDIKKRIMQKKVSQKKKAKEAEYNQQIEVRDAREKEFFIVDDAYLNGYAKTCGVHASMVYFALCRHAGKDQTCFPSVGLMGSKLGMAKKTVIKGLRVLEDHKIIKVDRLHGQPNIYTLTNKRHWRKFLVSKVIPGKASVSSLKAFKELNGMGGDDTDK
jgi:hypothetical protein